MPVVIACYVRLPRVWIIACALAILIVGVVGAAGVLQRPLAHPGDTVTLPGGRATFRAPDGWRWTSCTNQCTYLRTPHGPHIAIAVIVLSSQPAPIATGPQALPTTSVPRDLGGNPGTRFLTVNGVKFVRAWIAANPAKALPATTLLYGRLRDGWISVSCWEWSEPDLVRSGCDVVLRSLHVRR
jgi:hypothetical protein